MAQVSVSTAAKLVARDRKTLYRMIKEGKLSATTDTMGQRQVETSELVRVFGEIGQGDSNDNPAIVSMPQATTQDATVAAAVRLAVLEAELRHKDHLLAAKDEQIADLRQSVRLLAPPERKQSIWTRPIYLWPRSKL